MSGAEPGKPAGNDDTLTDQLRSWYEHSPTAQRAYTRLRADLDAVMDKARPKIEEFWQQIGPMIDPPPRDDATSRQDDTTLRQEHAHSDATTTASTSPGASSGAANTPGSHPS